MYGEPIISRGDAAEVLEFVEAAFDSVSRLVDFEVVRDQAFAGWIQGMTAVAPMSVMRVRKALLS